MEWHASAAMPLPGSKEQVSETAKAQLVAKIRIRFLMNGPPVLSIVYMVRGREEKEG
jgi:hypothetical protein